MPEPYSRDVLHERSGEVFSFPSGTSDEEVDRVFRSARLDAQAQNGIVPRLGQVLLEGARQFAQPSESTLPNIGGGAMVGLTPQQAQSTLQMAQQSNQDALRTKIEREHMMQRNLEQEANRATELKLQKQLLKNRMDERKLMEDTARFQAEQEGITKTIEAEEKTRQAEIKAMSEYQVLSPGQVAYNPFTQEKLVGPEKTYAPQTPPRPFQETRSMFDPETNQLMDYRITYDPANGMVMSQVPLGPSAPRGSGAGGGGMSEYQRLQAIQNYAQSILRAQAEAVVEPGDEGYKSPEQIFDEAAAMVDRMISSPAGTTPQSAPAPTQGPTPEQQEEMRVLRQSGAQVAFDPSTGEVVYVGGR